MTNVNILKLEVGCCFTVVTDIVSLDLINDVPMSLKTKMKEDMMSKRLASPFKEYFRENSGKRNTTRVK